MFLDGNDRASLKMLPVQRERPSHESDVPFRANLFDAELKNARRRKSVDHQGGPEIQIAGEHGRTVLAGPRHDRLIRGILPADIRPMNRIHTGVS